jgi:SAM-dependent methyltransferase
VTGRWQQTISLHDYDPDRDLADPHTGLSPTLVELIRQEASGEKRVIEIGCGGGRLTRAIASFFGEVIALDRSEPALAEAQLAAAREGWGHVSFRLVDAEQADYRALAAGPLHIVVAHLCMSNDILTRAAALGPGTILAFAAFHRDQWRETGVISRFAYSEASLEAALADTGFHPCTLALEKEIFRFRSPEQALAYLEKSGLEAKWQSSDRWRGFLTYLRGGGDCLTVRARVVVKACRT